MANIQDELRSRVDAFVAELTTLVRLAALESVNAALGQGRSAAPAARATTEATTGPRRRGRPRKTAAAPVPPAATARPAAAPSRRAVRGEARRPGQKRDPKDLARLVERLHDYIKANPGRRMEQIIPALGVPRKELALPIQKLIAGGRITSKGEKRGTVYTAKV